MEKCIRLGLISLLLACLIYCTIIAIAFPINPKKQYCGTVIKKFNEEVHIKHGSRTDLYLIVQFKGFQKAVNVDILTYGNSTINKNICFQLEEKVSNWFRLGQGIGFLVLLVIGSTVIILFVSFIFNGINGIKFWFSNKY